MCVSVDKTFVLCLKSKSDKARAELQNEEFSSEFTDLKAACLEMMRLVSKKYYSAQIKIAEGTYISNEDVKAYVLEERPVPYHPELD